MNVQIVSAQAIIHGQPSILWHGDVELPEDARIEAGGLVETWTDEATNAYLFRYFNRVDEEDGDRMRDADYTLPSLSVGDLIHWGSKTWRVVGEGFELLTGSSEYAMEITRSALLGPSEALKGGGQG